MLVNLSSIFLEYKPARPLSNRLLQTNHSSKRKIFFRVSYGVTRGPTSCFTVVTVVHETENSRHERTPRNWRNNLMMAAAKVEETSGSERNATGKLQSLFEGVPLRRLRILITQLRGKRLGTLKGTIAPLDRFIVCSRRYHGAIL